MKDEHTTRKQAPAGRYAQLDALRGQEQADAPAMGGMTMK